jgi:hypothetical protein
MLSIYVFCVIITSNSFPINPVVLYGCETWSVTLRVDKKGWRCSGIMVLSRIYAPERDEVTGNWRTLHNEEIQDFSLLTKHYLGDPLRNEMGEACGTWEGKERDILTLLVGKPKGTNLLWRHRCKWEHNIKMGLKEIGQRPWIGLSWLRIGASGWFSSMR